HLALFELAPPPLHLHSFPTRRSSDLLIVAHKRLFLTEFRHIFRRLAFRRISSPMQLHLRAGVLSAARVTRSSFSKLEVPTSRLRSEEHTSELQSRENLVCRLLLEKKK